MSYVRKTKLSTVCMNINHKLYFDTGIIYRELNFNIIDI